MIPVKQTILHDPTNGQHGNCLSVVLASLLHVPIDTVPVFSSPYPGWIRELNDWLRPFGLAYMTADNLEYICEEVGIEGLYGEVYGPTLRSSDVLHACVGIDGEVEFDPHPDDTGLTAIHGAGFFIILEPWRLNPGPAFLATADTTADDGIAAADVALLNKIDAQGKALAALVAELRAAPGIDQRWASIGATDLQTGLMALARAVEQPEHF